MVHYDENDKEIDINTLEVQEQNDARRYIKPNDIVLELGGRYGTVSTIINNILSNKKNHVVVEPDKTVLNALKKNREINNCEYYIFDGIISNKKNKIITSNGYGTYVSDASDVSDNNFEVLSYKELCDKYNIKFNTIVADCEGCLLDVLESIGDDIKYIDKILYENDERNPESYKKIKKILNKHFKPILLGFHSVYINNNNIYYIFIENCKNYYIHIIIIILIFFIGCYIYKM
jgi:FkbM family methyltransferase